MEKKLKKFKNKLKSRIENLKFHLRINKKDKHSRLGLIKMINRKKKDTKYKKKRKWRNRYTR